jgi:outer membrane protein assembly factor BamD
MRSIVTTLLLALLSAGLLGGCGSGIKDDPILRLSAQEALTEGKALLEQEKYSKARKYLTHAFEVEPNSRSGREALLLVADTYYLQGGRLNFIDAESKYKDFLNRFPTSDQAAYAQFQLANSLAKRIGRADRDQSATLKAYQAFEELMRLYPTSEYAEQAQEQIRLVEQSLAEHEFQVGRFYRRYGNHPGAIERFEYLLETYPDYEEMDKVLFFLGSSYREGRSREYQLKAQATFDRLREEYPDSEYVSEIPEVHVPPVQEASDGDSEDENQGDGKTEDGKPGDAQGKPSADGAAGKAPGAPR